MIKVVGVRFRSAGKIYTFDVGDFSVKPGAHVIVETSRGTEMGTVVGNSRIVEEENVPQGLKSVLRLADEEDEARAAALREKERGAMAVCREKIREHQLDMKLIDAEYMFDGSKILFHFTAEGRVDFRDLVKDLAAVFRMRIELRQIGVRDETKYLGGIGICGRPLCCHTYLTDFAPVSIRMAKEQNLSLNPAKISGVCGRLMCCLKNEEETYEYLNSKLPAVGETVTVTESGVTGVASSVNVLRQRVKVMISTDDEKEIREYRVEELSFQPRKKKQKGGEKKEAAKEKEPQELSAQENGEHAEGNSRKEGRSSGKRRKENRKADDGNRDNRRKERGNDPEESGNIRKERGNDPEELAADQEERGKNRRNDREDRGKSRGKDRRNSRAGRREDDRQDSRREDAGEQGRKGREDAAKEPGASREIPGEQKKEADSSPGTRP